MDNPVLGTGSGGDRCTEAVGAMIDSTYKITTYARLGSNTEQLMYKFTELLNNGRDVSVPENAQWIERLILSQTHGQMYLSDTTWPNFAELVACIDRGHLAIGGFDDYVNLRTSDGQNPYAWHDPHGLGHVLLIVGYDDINRWVAVHDPLQALSRQPRWYSWQGFQAAGFHDLVEVNGPPVGTTSGFIFGGGGPLSVPTVTGLIQFIIDFILAILQYVGYMTMRYGHP